MAADLFRLERESGGQVRVVRTADELDRAVERGEMAAVLHFEGAEPLDPELDSLRSSTKRVFAQSGLFTAGQMPSPSVFRWLSRNAPDTGPGLTDLGRRGEECTPGDHDGSSPPERAGTWDAPSFRALRCRVTFLAHAVCPSTRNLTDDQIRAIGETNGMIGLNFHLGFVRPDGALETDTPPRSPRETHRPPS